MNAPQQEERVSTTVPQTILSTAAVFALGSMLAAATRGLWVAPVRVLEANLRSTAPLVPRVRRESGPLAGLRARCVARAHLD